jgi:hypothetical protein
MEAECSAWENYLGSSTERLMGVRDVLRGYGAELEGEWVSDGKNDGMAVAIVG